jgi:transmembrane sensor
MKNVFDFPSNEQVDQKILEQEAVEWLVKLDSDTEPTEGELKALKEWMGRSPAHAKEIKSLNAFSGDLLILTDLNIPLVKTLSKEHSKTRSVFSSRIWAMTACIISFALLLQLVIFPDGFSGIKQFDSTNGYYTSAIGRNSSVPLNDGSVVVLNTNSQIKVEYTEMYRDIHLIQGEAHFDVSKNKDRPFRVFAGKGRVQAVGTAFTVYLDEQDVDVLVTEGKVELAALSDTSEKTSRRSGGKSLNQQHKKNPEIYIALSVEKLGLLEAGEGVTIHIPQKNIDKNQLPNPQIKTMDDKQRKRRDTWRQGFVIFTGDTLEDVIAEIGRYSPVKIKIVDPELKKIRIGGQFRVGDLDGLFATLEFSFGLNIKLLNNDRVEITASEI